MEYDIYELMRGLHDDSVPLPEDRAADLRRIKELTMDRIQANQDTHGTRPIRRMTRMMLAAAIAAVLCIATVAAAKLGVADAFSGFFGQLNESQRQVMETLGTTDLPAPVTSHGTTITPVAAICDKHNYYLRLRVEAPAGTALHIPDPDEAGSSSPCWTAAPLTPTFCRWLAAMKRPSTFGTPRGMTIRPATMCWKRWSGSAVTDRASATPIPTGPTPPSGWISPTIPPSP